MGENPAPLTPQEEELYSRMERLRRLKHKEWQARAQQAMDKVAGQQRSIKDLPVGTKSKLSWLALGFLVLLGVLALYFSSYRG
jgi:hypothetical protein